MRPACNSLMQVAAQKCTIFTIQPFDFMSKYGASIIMLDAECNKFPCRCWLWRQSRKNSLDLFSKLVDLHWIFQFSNQRLHLNFSTCSYCSYDIFLSLIFILDKPPYTLGVHHVLASPWPRWLYVLGHCSVTGCLFVLDLVFDNYFCEEFSI